MLPTYALLRQRLRQVIADKTEQGHVTSGLEAELLALPDSYDRLWAFAERLPHLPIRDDWPYVEPNDWTGIEAELDPARPRVPLAGMKASESAERVKAAFLGSVCGCMLGKPIEVNPTLDEIRAALEMRGEWPLRDYFSQELRLRNNRTFHSSWKQTTRENLVCVAPDDDLNYTILGLLLIEEHGIDFTHDHMRRKWLENIPPYFAWGPERTFINTATTLSFADEWLDFTPERFARIDVVNPGDELCGAMIRADAYGYACAGHPALAAQLAWRDASLTHRRTGVYGTMFAAAAIAAAPAGLSPLDIFRVALQFVPRRSRFHHIVSDSLEQVAAASDWLEGYRRIHGRYRQYAHCRVYQESGTLINTLRFAANVGDGICKQVSQGNDTDSYGATAGSILGMYFGPGHLEPRWLAPLNDTIHTTLADFHEQSLSRLTARMAKLPALIAQP